VGRRGSTNDPEDCGRLRPLHGGRHGIPPDLLSHDQRERLIAALASCVAENGYNATTITQITATAAVSRRTFYEQFDGKEACFLAAYEALDSHLAMVIGEAVESESEWPGQVAATFEALIALLASRPALARLYLVESAVVGEPIAEARERTVRRFTTLLESGREYSDRLADPPERIEEGLIGGILTLLGCRLRTGEAELEFLLPVVLEFALAPYLGANAAHQVAASHSDRVIAQRP